ncbi:hypothetical protein J4Q44_G00031400 [Coregonus suidteri]|uniref:Uncharacterized protein n=1 Tax=Coregonus suidteri TaxID=861788 RepID=A0AAN8M9X9_9TELE
MHRLTHYRFLSVCLTGVLLLLPLCWGQYVYDDYGDTTLTPDYDYNATIEYSFFSNTSTEDLDKFLSASEEEDDKGEEEDTTFSTAMSTTDSSIVTMAKGSRTAPPCLLLALGLTVHQLGQLL